jgi:hypothetical protein
MGDGLYRIENVPCFAKRVSLADLVDAELVDGLPTFKSVRERGGHSTLRVAVSNRDDIPGLRSKLEELGAPTEVSHLPRLISVDIPPGASLDDIRVYLNAGATSGAWEVEEADVPASREARP